MSMFGEIVENLSVFEAVLDRKNYLIRQSSRNRHAVHVIAANIDQAVLVTTVVQPSMKWGFVDRFLVTTESRNIETLIVINKSDLITKKNRVLADEAISVYADLGYQVFLCSSLTQDGTEEIRLRLKGKTSLFSGQSGVGKSSLLNCLFPELELRTGQLSNYTGKGVHTTTFAELMSPIKGTDIIDTPGIKTLGFNYMDILDIAHNFREFVERADECRFGFNCVHRSEPDCAVRDALESGRIHPLRYQSYISILDEIEAQNHWEKLKGY